MDFNSFVRKKWCKIVPCFDYYLIVKLALFVYVPTITAERWKLLRNIAFKELIA